MLIFFIYDDYLTTGISEISTDAVSRLPGDILKVSDDSAILDPTKQTNVSQYNGHAAKRQ